MWSVMNYLNAIDLYKLLHFPGVFVHTNNSILLELEENTPGLYERGILKEMLVINEWI